MEAILAVRYKLIKLNKLLFKSYHNEHHLQKFLFASLDRAANNIDRHKPSPLSGMATIEGKKHSGNMMGIAEPPRGPGETNVIVFTPDQTDTAEGSLLRAIDIWKQSATRGDPNSPHGKILRQLRGEQW